MKSNEKNNTKIFVLGIDGGTFDIINPLIKEGKLPNIQKIIKNGVCGKLKSTFPPVTGPAWTSFMTGKNIDKHGIFDFHECSFEYKRKLVNSTFIKSEKLWKIMNRFDKKVGIIGVPMTYPPEEVNGFMITGFGTPSDKADFAYPPTLHTELVMNIGPYIVDIYPMSYEENDEIRYLTDLYNSEKCRIKAVKYLMKYYDWDFFMVVFSGADYLQHFFWKYRDESHPAHNPKTHYKYKDVIPQYYQRIDSIIGEIWNRLDENTVLMIMSDHGGGPHKKKAYINRWLEKLGLLFVKSEFTLKYEDITKIPHERIELHEWIKLNHIHDFCIEDDILFIKSIGNDPHFYNPKISFKTDDNSYILINMRSSESGVGQVFYDIGMGYREADSASFDVEKSRFNQYLIKLPENKTINSLRIDPLNKMANLEIKDIMIFSSHLEEKTNTEIDPNIDIKINIKGVPDKIDWGKTKAYSGYETEIGIYVNLKGREPEGIVNPGKEYEKLRDYIIKELKNLTDPETNEHIIDWVKKREELYSENFKNGPDILFMMKGMEYISYEELKDEIFEISKWRSGTHRMDGIFMAIGRNIRKGQEIENAEIVDIAPTILYAMGIPVPRDIDGRVLTDIFEKPHLESNPIRYTRAENEDEVIKHLAKFFSKEDEEDVKRRLRSLGYIE